MPREVFKTPTSSFEVSVLPLEKCSYQAALNAAVMTASAAHILRLSFTIKSDLQFLDRAQNLKEWGCF